MKGIIDDIEFESVETIKEFQNRKLQDALRYLDTRSVFYRKMFKENGINIQQITTVEDLVNLPFTEKKDLQLYNQEFLCVAPEKIVDYVTTSGTLGDPVTFGCTDSDLERLAYNEMKSFSCAGIKPAAVHRIKV